MFQLLGTGRTALAKRSACQDGTAGPPHASSTATPDSSTTSTATVGKRIVEIKPSTLLDELADALVGAVAVYGMADVRRMLRAGQAASAAGTENPCPLRGNPDLLEKALKLPISREEMMQLLQANVDVLHQAKIPADLYLSLLDSLDGCKIDEDTSCPSSGKRRPPDDGNENNSGKWLYSVLKAHMFSSAEPEPRDGEGNRYKPSVVVTVFDDENGDKELVYYIAVDEERHLIKVVFRGSVTVGDWMADVDSRMATIPNPLLAESEEVEIVMKQSKTISIHQGFYTYLFGTSKTSPVSKYQTIMGHLKRLLDAHNGYKIRASGHSLGGALSTLFAFHAACDDSLPKPVMCVSFAAPRAGNLEFARAHQECEVSGRLRSIRVANEKDVVTMVPDRLAYAVALTNSIYRHVGIEVRLFSSSKKGGAQHPPKIHFPTCHSQLSRHLADDMNSAVWNWFTRPVNLMNSWRHDYALFHSCKEYSDRLARTGDHLSSITIDKLVSDYMRHCHS